MDYGTYKALMDQAQVTGWTGVVLIALGLLVAVTIVPSLYAKAKRDARDAASRVVSATLLLIVCLGIMSYGASQARWLLNPRGYVVEHYKW